MNKFKFVLSMPIMMLLLGCTNNNQAPTLPPAKPNHIIDGERAVENSFIARATVILNTQGGKYCTGVLLNDHVALTAAHCVQNRVVLTVAIPGAKKSCFISTVAEVALAPLIPGNSNQPDLALLKLTKPLCTPPPTVLDGDHGSASYLTAAGYGEGTKPGLPDFFDMTLTSAEKEDLRSLFLDGYEDNNSVREDWDLLDSNYADFQGLYLFALAKNPAQSLCMGDSGGPIYREYDGVLHIYGVVGGAFPHSTKGVFKCQSSYLQFFAPIAPHLPWLTEKLQSWH